MSNSNNKQISSLTMKGIAQSGEIKDGPDLYCIRQRHKVPSPLCFTNDRNHQLFARLIEVNESPGGSAELIVDFIINDDEKLRGSIDYHPERKGTGSKIGFYQIL